jgi:hypothetical protein
MSTPDDVVQVSDTEWKMWAVANDRGVLSDPGHRRSAQANCSGTSTVVPVTVRENENGTYYGWMRPTDDYPVMIHGHMIALNMCFPQGAKVEEQQGHGRIVRLTVEKNPPR